MNSAMQTLDKISWQNYWNTHLLLHHKISSARVWNFCHSLSKFRCEYCLFNTFLMNPYGFGVQPLEIESCNLYIRNPWPLFIPQNFHHQEINYDNSKNLLSNKKTFSAMKITFLFCLFISVQAAVRARPTYRRVSVVEARMHPNFHSIPRARIRKTSLALKVHLKQMIVMRRNLI